MTSVLVKRPVAFRIPRVVDDKLSGTEWRYFANEEVAYNEAQSIGAEVQGLYVRDGTAIVLDVEEALEAAVDRMGWPEIHAFQNELRRGQCIREDAGGFMMRAIRRLFGLPSPLDEVVTYQHAARAMVAKALSSQDRGTP